MSKWLNKRRQAAKEVMNKTAEHTELDPGYVQMQHETDCTRDAVKGLVDKIPYYLHPNPAQRLRTGLASKKGAENGQKRYKHAIIDIQELVTKCGSELDEESAFGKSLAGTGEAFQEMLDLQYALDDKVNQDVIDPWKALIDQDFKDIAYHRKKLNSRRLDYDFKRTTNEGLVAKGKPVKYSESDVKVAEEKFNDSKAAAENGMAQMIDTDVEQITQLKALVTAMSEYHSGCSVVLAALTEKMEAIVDTNKDKPKREYLVEKAPTDYNDSDDEDMKSPRVSATTSPTSEPSATAVYDFVAENEGELSFSEGDTIMLTERLDENWLSGVNPKGQSGIFPCNYVEIVKDL
eukprot:m.188711 g.188711  ORF g.188711 m.188711 type:complete len:348 (-) comp32355_c1_seq1:132-1175(-)